MTRHALLANGLALRRTRPAAAKAKSKHSRAGDTATEKLGFVALGSHAGSIQAKLEVGEPDDQLEKEADRVAEHVMRTSDSASVETYPPALIGDTMAAPLLQRACSSCDEGHKIRRSLAPRGSATTESSAAPVGFARELSTARAAGGAILPSSLRTFMEPRFGRDFSRVRVHRDARADALTRSVSARAFTVGHDVFFRSAEFQPSTTGGRHLIAHELTHVVQQGRGMRRGFAQRQVTPTSGTHERGCGAHGPPDPEGHPLVYSLFDVPQRSLIPERAKRPAVGHAQRLLNQFLSRFDDTQSGAGAAQVGCAFASESKKLEATKLRAQLPGQIEVDCSFGLETKKAARIFQLCKGLKDDGMVGEKTWPELERVASPVTPPKPAPAPSCKPVTCPLQPVVGPLAAPAALAPWPQLRDPRIPGDGVCRSACGGGCPDSCNRLGTVQMWVTADAGGCFTRCDYLNVLQCYTHLGCRQHDNCLDSCAMGGGGMFGGCGFGCHKRCVDRFGSSTCIAWARGDRSAPSDGELLFTDARPVGTVVPGPCPTPGSCFDTTGAIRR